MSIGSETLKTLASLGANLEVGPGYGSETLKTVVSIVVQKGAHITVDASKIGSEAAKTLARIGGKHITLKV